MDSLNNLTESNVQEIKETLQNNTKFLSEELFNMTLSADDTEIVCNQLDVIIGNLTDFAFLIFVVII